VEFVGEMLGLPQLVIGIDPGINASGYCVLRKGKIFKGGLSPVVKGKNPLRAVSELLSALKTTSKRRHVVIEIPQKDKRLDELGCFDDLINLSLAVGAMGYGFKSRRTASADSVKYVRPREWKGSMPKKVTENRLKMSVPEDELSKIVWPCKYLQHNVWDAIGIAKWYWDTHVLKQRMIAP